MSSRGGCAPAAPARGSRPAARPPRRPGSVRMGWRVRASRRLRCAPACAPAGSRCLAASLARPCPASTPEWSTCRPASRAGYSIARPACETLTGMSAPSVTAVVTVHNQARYLAEALASVLAQTRAPLDVVVLDDGSTDEPGGVCAQFGAAVTYVRQPRRGVGAARNAGLRHARGDFLAYLDGDDVWEPGHVEAQVTALDRVPGAGLVITDGVEFDEGGIRCDGLL